jgi:hypothetical protein
MTLFKYWFTGFNGLHPDLFGRPNFVPKAFDRQQAVDALQMLLGAFHLHEGLGFPAWGQIHRLHRQTGPQKVVSWPVAGDSSALRAAAGKVDPKQGTIAVTNGQTCPMLVQVGRDNAGTRIRYSKALDNCVDWRLPGVFGTRHSEEWAAERYRDLYTQRSTILARTVRREVLTFPR